MKAIFISFKQLLSQISKDNILIAVCLAPIIAGVAFKFGIPIVETLLSEYLRVPEIIATYYLLIDIFLAILTPYMFSFASAMVILEEKDTGITNYLSVTPIGKTGYLVSRLLLPMAVSVPFSIIVLLCFSLSNISIFLIILLSLLATSFGLIPALFIVSFSTNKVEGMALAKLSNIITLGLPLPFFIDGVKQYWGAFLPSFWVAKFMIDFSLISLFMSVAVIIIWVLFLSRKFIKKLY